MTRQELARIHAAVAKAYAELNKGGHPSDTVVHIENATDYLVQALEPLEKELGLEPGETEGEPMS